MAVVLRLSSQVIGGDSIVPHEFVLALPGRKTMTVRSFTFLCLLIVTSFSIAADQPLTARTTVNARMAQVDRAVADGEATAADQTTDKTADADFPAGKTSELTEAEEFLNSAFQPPEEETPKRSTGLLLSIYCIAIMGASMAGGWLPSVIRLTHTRMQTIISFVGGLMLGIAVFHLLPHSIHGTQSADDSAWWMMAGIITMFLLIRCFHFHHHGPLEISTAEEDPCASHRDHDHDHRHDHDHSHAALGHREHEHGSEDHVALPQLQVLTSTQPHCHHAHQMSWLGITLGLSLHTLIDGMALAASVQAESTLRPAMSLFGLGTFLAIMLHKPLDAVSITSLMAGAGWSPRSRFFVSIGFSAMCPLGAILFGLGISLFGGYQEQFVCSALAFSAGVFLCISLSDLLPEMEFHAHNRVRLTAALLAGILLAYGITFLEPGHLH